MEPNTMTVILYKLDASPAARVAMMGLGLFGVEAKLVDVDLVAGEHMTPEFLKKNVLHSVPVLEDGDLVIHDSHAILQYLADKYGKDDTLYPKDVNLRALVNQKLFFDTGYLFPRVRNITYPALFLGVRHVPQEKLDDIVEAYGFLEEFLSRTKYLAGNHITIADVAAIASVSSLNCIVPIDNIKYPKTTAWVKEMEAKPYYKKYNEPGLKQIDEIVKTYVDL